MTDTGPFFQTSTVDGAFVVEVCRPVGSLSDSQVMTEFDGVLAALGRSGLHQVLVDLRQTPYFGSSLLEALRHLWNKVHPQNGRMVLCNASPVGREILELAKFDHLWPIVSDRKMGLAKLADAG
jgi:anti-anti-sigma factor